MKKPLRGTLATASFVSWVHARNNASDLLITRSGTLQFVRDDHDFVARPFKQIFDRLAATTLVHFAEADWESGTVTRVLVQTAYGPALYDAPPFTTYVTLGYARYGQARALAIQ
jgi:hypothetical protein